MKIFSSKPINMGSSFEDLDARNPTVKTVQNLDAWFKRRNILNKRIYEKRKNSQVATCGAHATSREMASHNFS